MNTGALIPGQDRALITGQDRALIPGQDRALITVQCLGNCSSAGYLVGLILLQKNIAGV